MSDRRLVVARTYADGLRICREQMWNPRNTLAVMPGRAFSRLLAGATFCEIVIATGVTESMHQVLMESRVKNNAPAFFLHDDGRRQEIAPGDSMMWVEAERL